MRLILTHEQADFDALAASLAAHLLDPESIPVLPRRLNRNVRAYLTLYGDRLPYLEYDELPKDRIQRITLVDTQSMVSVKGFAPQTQVHVIDHHPADNSLDPGWTNWIETVGATTTLLVEELREAGIELNLVATNMLLLGIYEDTGSLTYSGTTPRDLMASAWLLEQGASLSLISDFLNHPLSAEQRALYERLLEAAETHEFQGISVVLATAKVDEPVDEISSLAHKLRDVFDPAGLFVLVETDSHVQLVARSTTDSIDVSKIAQQLGGGGHARAAAAMIRDRSLEQARAELLDLLPEAIKPPKTVGQIMSRGPQLLSPETSVAKAAERMQRFGHEGYPVVDDGEVVGLLTRRAVDRAMAHRMGDRPVSDVMEAGDLVVHPQDSVQRLQQVMIEYDWGQVPVADAETGAIIGIVTRTDLLKTLAGEIAPGLGANVAAKIEAALPPSRYALLHLIAKEGEKEDIAVYVVGGFVRDLLLGTPSMDYDLVTEGDAIRLARGLAERYGGRVSGHRRFGTAKWFLARDEARLRSALGLDAEDAVERDAIPEAVDLVTARSEFYAHPTALPTVERGSIKLDLHRRDFTINTLAIRLDGRYYGQLLDHWGGGQDLRQGVIRVLHSLSFVDDPTRALRAVRLEQRLGFEIESRTLQLLQDALPLLDRVSGERIRSELSLIFQEPSLSQIMVRLADLGLLEAIHPALAWDDWLRSRWQEARGFEPPAGWKLAVKPESDLLMFGLWMYRLPPDQARQVADRLHLAGGNLRSIVGGLRLKAELPSAGLDQARPSELAGRMDVASTESLVIAWLAEADRPPVRAVIDHYLTTWCRVKPGITGHDLQAMSLPPGPAYAKILKSLRDAWLDGEIKSPGEEEALLDQLVKDVREQG